jgi:hypothetical protein
MPGTESNASNGRLTYERGTIPHLKGIPYAGIKLATNKPSELSSGSIVAITIIILDLFNKWNPTSPPQNPDEVIKDDYD